MPHRKRLPATRQSITHKFDIAGHEGYITVGKYKTGAPGELFITMAKEGSTVGGFMDAFGISISLCLQNNVSLKTLCSKFMYSKFEPSGFTQNKDIPIAQSIVDYIFRWLAIAFPDSAAIPESPTIPVIPAGIEVLKDKAKEVPAPASDKTPGVEKKAVTTAEGVQERDTSFKDFQGDAPACDICGAITVRNGSCYRCFNCGNSMGCS